MSPNTPFNAGYLVTLSYPRGAAFDMAYYTEKHMPLTSTKWAPYVLDWSVATFKEGPYQVVAYCYYESEETYKKATEMKEATDELMGDIKNYTDAKPDTAAGTLVARG